MTKLTLPTDSTERKDIPLRGGCYNYFPAALMGVAMWSKKGNDKHNKGQPLHHARGKSMDHEECIERHSSDLADLQAQYDRHYTVYDRQRLVQAMLDEYDARAWRALAASQEFRERQGLAPLAPGARIESPPGDGLDKIETNPFAKDVKARYEAISAAGQLVDCARVSRYGPLETGDRDAYGGPTSD